SAAHLRGPTELLQGPSGSLRLGTNEPAQAVAIPASALDLWPRAGSALSGSVQLGDHMPNAPPFSPKTASANDTGSHPQTPLSSEGEFQNTETNSSSDRAFLPVSVCIANWNCRNLLRDCLASLRLQAAELRLEV